MNLSQLARKTIEAYFQNKNFKPDEKYKEKYKEKKASFVTLTKNNKLRGCIGSLFSIRQLYKDVQENAINSAFHDSRFSPLEKQELKKIKIEVSILSKPKKLKFKTPEELLKKINNKMGIILKKGFHNATFLPQVWKQIPDKIEFLEHLSLKTGLNKNTWRDAEIWCYGINTEKEKNHKTKGTNPYSSFV